jgi:hypothetical protein
MAARTKEVTRGKKLAPRSLAIAKGGIHSGNDFAAVFSALMSDLIEGRMDPQIGNAVCNAGGKLLKVVEMQYKYGKANGDTSSSKVLMLTQPTVSEPSSVQ